ncbi:hypothetical protein RB195_017436 [Necator americanus]|uniref:L-Fucosyltransferase n=1 Tax=Necator americanus TaxID=51031 RepID=A0ABR1C750_NECAM
MIPACRRSTIAICILTVVVVVQLYKYHYTATVYGSFVAIESNGGRIGNQLFHLCSGHAIARKISRRHYIRTLNIGAFHIAKHIEKIEKIFPRLADTFVVMEVGNEYRVPFAQKNGEMSCCEYEDPSRLRDKTQQFLVLEMRYAQNVRYFEDILPEIRYLLDFADDVKQQGNEVLQRWNMKNRVMCVHIRRSDFVRLNLATNLNESVRKARNIARRQKLSQFLIFGDDVDFMRRMAERMLPDKVFFSTFTEGIDFFLASKICGGMLMTTPMSTFGWWLSFFAPNQDAIFFNNDSTTMDDKYISQDLFLPSWKPYVDKIR